MFAYCRNNPIRRADAAGRDEEDCFAYSPKDELVPEFQGGSSTSANSGPTQVGTTGTNGRGAGNFTVTKGSNGIAAVPNPNNEPTDVHHIVEQCQAQKSGFARVDIQGNRNLLTIPRPMHNKISGIYSSKQDYSGDLRVRNWLATKSWEFQEEFGWNIINQVWDDMYGN